MNKLFSYIGSSFDTHSQGASARKLSAFVTMFLIVYCHRFVDTANIVEVLIADSGLLCVLLGITTYEKIKLNNTPTVNPQPDEQN